ncbi:hypothetical protein [Streptomyces sp. N50]|uniref:hypothetical protein n=1 Tax=Streptomyces sp. N50 TaxID=3081765 RepID=UPI0029624B4C|nr:hypothetical protein [Streptomyces sp. N50]WOX13217.1 hypothetical protein R2B38_32285 [Streptomyces sp. N50]
MLTASTSRLSNLAQESLFAVAYGRRPAELSRDLAARAAFGDHQVYAVRERLALSGREEVVAVADTAFSRLKTFRDAVGSGAAPDSPELADAIQSYGTVLRAPRLETDASNWPFPARGSTEQTSGFRTTCLGTRPEPEQPRPPNNPAPTLLRTPPPFTATPVRANFTDKWGGSAPTRPAVRNPPGGRVAPPHASTPARSSHPPTEGT